jgi:ABC-type phosphate transport system ATPase subunit
MVMNGIIVLQNNGIKRIKIKDNMQKIQSNNVNFYYGENRFAHFVIDERNTVTALSEPSDVSQRISRLLNRMNDPHRWY